MVTKSMMRGILICGMRYAVCGEHCARSQNHAAVAQLELGRANQTGSLKSQQNKNIFALLALAEALQEREAVPCVALMTLRVSLLMLAIRCCTRDLILHALAFAPEF